MNFIINSNKKKGTYNEKNTEDIFKYVSVVGKLQVVK